MIKFFLLSFLLSTFATEVPTFSTWNTVKKGTLSKHAIALTYSGNGKAAFRDLATGAGFTFAPGTTSTRVMTIPAKNNVTISIEKFPSRLLYLYLSQWPVGVYKFNYPVTLKSKSTGGVASGKKLKITKGGFKGIIQFPKNVATIKWSGTPKNPAARLGFGLAIVSLKVTTTKATTTTTTAPAPTPSPSTSSSGPGAGFGLTAQQALNLLNDHNTARRTLASPPATNMLALKWDPILAKTAYNYLVNVGCANGFKHNADRSTQYWNNGGRNAGSSLTSAYVGENWYSSAPDAATDAQVLAPVFKGAVDSWTTEECYEGGTTCDRYGCSEADYFYNRPVSTTGAACNPTTWEDWGHFSQVMWATTAYVGCGYTVACGTLCDYAVGGNVFDQNAVKPSDLPANTIWQGGP